MPDPRTAVMIVVEASWRDQAGDLWTVPARMEDKSARGVCIKTKTPIGVGSRLKLQSHWEQISGIARYCRHVGKDYLVGIERDTATSSILAHPMPDLPKGESETSGEPPGSAGIQSQPEPEIRNVQSVAIAISPPTMDEATESRSGPRSLQSEETGALLWAEPPIERSTKKQEIGKERKSMQHKWSDLIHRNDRQNEPTATGNGTSKAVAADELSADAKERVDSFRVELLPVEDIYRAAGIMNLRRGYSISKVVGMLHGEFARGLSSEAKRAAILMALDAAGIPVDELLQDARARQDALNSYEAGVRKEVESEWARKTEENIKIQDEMERVKSHYMARIARNLDGVAREKAVFGSWLATKQQECQNISEAADLCSKTGTPEPVGGSLSIASAAAAGAKPLR